MDSITLLYDFKDRIALGISFDYGSNHNAKEIPFAEMHCQRLRIPHITIPLDFIHKYFKSSLLDGADAIPEGHYENENMKSTVVPFRNGIMLSIAAGIAESWGLDNVFIANHGGDHAIYPDCRPEFISAMCEATKAGSYNNVMISAPYTNITKADIARKGKNSASTTPKPGLATRAERSIAANAGLVSRERKPLKTQESQTIPNTKNRGNSSQIRISEY